MKITGFELINDSKVDFKSDGLVWKIKDSIFKYPTDSARLNMNEVEENPSNLIIVDYATNI